MEPLACCFHTSVPDSSTLFRRSCSFTKQEDRNWCHVRFFLHNSIAANIITNCLTEFLILPKNTLPLVVALLTVREATSMSLMDLFHSCTVLTDNISNHSCSISLSHSIYIHKHMVNGERQWHHANHLLIDSTLTHSSMCCQARAFSCSESGNVLGQN